MAEMEISLPLAIDLEHHVNAHSKARHPSPLKDILRFMAYDGMVSLAGGLPHPSLFPFDSLVVNTYPASTVLNPLAPIVPKENLESFEISKTGGLLDLSTALQYGGGTGDKSILKFAMDFTRLVHQPAYADFQVLLTLGNTDAWNKVVGLICEKGDYILCEEYTYPSAQALWVPLGCKAVPVGMDSGGMKSEDLERVLANWDVKLGRRPNLLYIVPVGSNPCGSTMDGERRKAVYDVCVKYDVIICEDDPYSFLQYPVFQPDTESKIGQPFEEKEFLASLAPSFLKFDYQGRVIRLDTFSKTLAPGNRIGYFVVSPVLWERLLRATEVETQAPSGWSQTIVANLLSKWGSSGYLCWLSNLRDQYRVRRDWMCNAIATNFIVKQASELSIPVIEGHLVAFNKDSSDFTKPLFSFVPPSAGMFIWATFYFESSNAFKALKANLKIEDPEQVFADDMWASMARELVLLTPGSYYTPWQGQEKTSTKARGAEDGIGHFRLAFSTPTKEEMEVGIQRMAKVLRSYVD